MAAGKQSIHQQIHTCVHCGFSFEKMEDGELRYDVKRFVGEFITPQLTEDEIPSWKKFEFMALIEERLDSESYSAGMLYLHAAWCSYDMEQKEIEKYYRRKVIEQFDRLISSEAMDRDLVYLVPYLLAEQYRRIEDKAGAAMWFDRVIKMDEEHTDRDFFIALAVQQKLHPKEYMGEIIHERP